MNIIVICSDTFRFDHLGFLNKQPVSTPQLDQFASESAVFADFWLCSFPTLVNRIEVFTGRYTFPLYDWGKLPYEFPTLSQVFKQNGFTTALIADNLHLFEDHFGFERGFDFVKNVPGQCHDPFQPSSAPMIDLPCPPEKLEPPPHRLDRYRRNAKWYQQQGTNTTATVFRSSMEWLQHPPEKFFLWIDAFDPHEPWDASVEFLKPYPWNKQGFAVMWPKSGEASQYSTADIENMRSLYKAEVTQIDYWMGQLLAKLRDKHLSDNTAIIFCSDHGYYFGEHGLIGKPLRCKEPLKIYEELGHIPLLIRHPKALGAGKTIRGLTQPPDLYATVLDLAGIPAVSWAQGHSLVPMLNGQVGQQKFAVGGCHPHKGRVGCLSVWTDEWSLVYSPIHGLGGSELFHIPTDPRHEHNVISKHPAPAQELFQRLEQWMKQLGVSSARQRQLLHNGSFTIWDGLQYKWWLSQRRRSYARKFSDYAI
jgi:arylsulfatase A-like enzyme